MTKKTVKETVETVETVNEVQLKGDDQVKMKKFTEDERVRILTEENIMLKQQILAISKDLNETKTILTNAQAKLLEFEAANLTAKFKDERTEYQGFVQDLSSRLKIQDGNWAYDADTGKMVKQENPPQQMPINAQRG